MTQFFVDEFIPRIEQLKSCQSLGDLAHILGYKPKSLSYILYKIPDDSKYTEFEIPKKSGGVRTIQAPTPRLKKLQKRLANLLSECEGELFDSQSKSVVDRAKTSKKKETRAKAQRAVSHGYKKGLSISTNAEMHIGKRYVFNIDLSNFFPSINFGRVRGFFIKNKKFKLHPKVATVIAQIACFDNQLPQGSPSSPVISNLIARPLDMALLKIAKDNSCSYTRYVDDITFSTNLKRFPWLIAYRPLKWFGSSKWLVSSKVKNSIEHHGFKVNKPKCRMQKAIERQEVTGLVVNKLVNVSSDYYRYARAMCNSIFQNGYYHLPEERITKPKSSSLIDWILRTLKIPEKEQPSESVKLRKQNSLNKLNGILAHIYNIKSYRNKYANTGFRKTKHDGIRNKENEKHPPLNRTQSHSDENHQVALDGIKNLYQKFLFFRHFYYNETPTIVCEGKTDNVYLRCAIESLANQYPDLIDANGKLKINFLNRTETTNEMLSMAEGVSGLKYLLDVYKRFTKKYGVQGQSNPVIIIVDNDKDGISLKNRADGLITKNRKANNITNIRPDNYVFENLYIVLIPSEGDEEKSIEDLFEPALLKKKLNGKEFHIENKGSDPQKHYGKDYFSRFVVKAQRKTINFSGFTPLLDDIKLIINSYDQKDLD